MAFGNRSLNFAWLGVGLLVGIFIGRWDIDPAPDLISPRGELETASHADNSTLQIAAGLVRLADTAPAALDPTGKQELAKEVRDLAAALPDSMVLEQIERITGIEPSTILSSGDPAAYVERLLDVALAGTIEPAIAELGAYGPVWFSSAGNRDNPVSVFGTDDKVVFANLESTGKAEALVKWLQVETGEPVLFKKVFLRPNERTRVWVRDFNGFAPGTYKVEFFSVETLELLSSGSYQVR